MRISCLKTSRLNGAKLAVYVVCACWFLVNPAWASDYKIGFEAYINGDFDLAREHWLKAANDKDGKSMFNLGLLHEQNKLDNSTVDKALNWYRLAADNGYAPAGYHLAQRMLERGGSDDEALALIRHAADNAYAPAMRYLNIGQAPSSHSQAHAVPKAVETKDKANSWINRQRGQHWTIQLLAFKQREQVEAFIKEHDLKSNSAYFSEAKEGEVFYKLVYGSYDSKDKASFARQNLAATLQQHGPWLRTWSSVHKITKP